MNVFSQFSTRFFPAVSGKIRIGSFFLAALGLAAPWLTENSPISFLPLSSACCGQTLSDSDEKDDFILEDPPALEAETEKESEAQEENEKLKMEEFPSLEEPELSAELELSAEPKVSDELELSAEPEVSDELELSVEPEVSDELELSVEPEVSDELELSVEPEVSAEEAKESVKTKADSGSEIPECSAEERALREKILKTLRTYDQISLCTGENRPLDVIAYVLPYGCDAEIFFGCREANTRINAIGALCWNVPMGNEVAFTENREKLMPRLGYGIQQYSGQILAALAIARVPMNYRFPAGWATLSGEDDSEAGEETELELPELAADSETPTAPRGKKRFGIRNLVEFEQQNCRDGRDLSQTLIALSYYLPPDAKWESSDGETWSLERIVQNELDRPISAGDSTATNQLLGLICAIRCRKMRTHEPLSGQYARAESYMERFQKFVLDLQNSIGIWHPEFFLKKGMTPEQPTEMLIASGHILRWLVTAMPRNELNDPRIFKAVSIVNELLEYQLTYWDPANASGTEIEGVMAALHALTIYEKRRFKD